MHGYDEPRKAVLQRNAGSRRRIRSQRSTRLILTTDGEMDMGDEESESETGRVTTGNTYLGNKKGKIHEQFIFLLVTLVHARFA